MQTQAMVEPTPQQSWGGSNRPDAPSCRVNSPKQARGNPGPFAGGGFAPTGHGLRFFSIDDLKCRPTCGCKQRWNPTPRYLGGFHPTRRTFSSCRATATAGQGLQFSSNDYFKCRPTCGCKQRWVPHPSKLGGTRTDQTHCRLVPGQLAAASTGNPTPHRWGGFAPTGYKVPKTGQLAEASRTPRAPRTSTPVPQVR